MAIATEDKVTKRLIMSREPVGPSKAGDKGTIGDVGFRDAVTIIVACWLIVFVLWFSLRSHNI